MSPADPLNSAPRAAPAAPSEPTPTGADDGESLPPRELLLLCGAAILAGVATGALGAAFHRSADLVRSLRESFVAWTSPLGAWDLAVVAAVIAVLALALDLLVRKAAPESSGSGIPHVKAVLDGRATLGRLLLIPVKFVGGALAIGAGFSLGREGPTVQMGAACGHWASRLFGLGRESGRSLIAGAAGAGLAAAFSAPLGGMVFMLEELRVPLRLRSALVMVLAGVAGAATLRALGVRPPFFEWPAQTPATLALLVPAGAVGILGGLVGVAFNRALLGAVRRRRRTRRFRWSHPLLVGASVAMAVWWLPQIVGDGAPFAQQCLVGGLVASWALLLALMAAKATLTILCYCSGVPGGLFAPLLVTGALLGQAVAALAGRWAPEEVGIFAALGMTAVFVGSVRSTLTGVLLMVEMTGHFGLTLPLAAAGVAAHVTAALLHDTPIYDALEHEDERRAPEAPAREAEGRAA